MNQEFNLYDYFEPVYINGSNELIPVIDNLFVSLYEVLSSLYDILLAFVVIVFQTGTFILKEAITHIDKICNRLQLDKVRNKILEEILTLEDYDSI